MADFGNDISYRPFTHEDLEMLNTWLAQQNKHPCDLSLLSTTGLVVSCNDIPLAVGFLYCTNSSMAMIEQITADPHGDKIARGNCVDALLYFLCEWAKALGNTVVIATGNIRKLIERAEKQDFMPIATSSTVLARSLT